MVLAPIGVLVWLLLLMTSPPPPESSLESEEDTEEDAHAREEDESSDISVLFFMLLLLVSLFSVREKLKCIPFRKVMYALFPNTRAQKNKSFFFSRECVKNAPFPFKALPPTLSLSF